MSSGDDNSLTAAEAARYITDMLFGLRKLAVDHRLDVLAYFIEMASIESALAAEPPDGPIA